MKEYDHNSKPAGMYRVSAGNKKQRAERHIPSTTRKTRAVVLASNYNSNFDPLLYLRSTAVLVTLVVLFVVHASAKDRKHLFNESRRGLDQSHVLGYVKPNRKLFPVVKIIAS